MSNLMNPRTELWLAARERSEARSEECEERGAAAARRSRAELKFFLSKAELVSAAHFNKSRLFVKL